MTLVIFAFVAAAVLAGCIAVSAYLTHHIAKRMKNGIYKVWPIGLSFAVFIAVSRISASDLFWSAIVMLIAHAIVWWRYEIWQLDAERHRIGREARFLQSRRRTLAHKRPFNDEVGRL